MGRDLDWKKRLQAPEGQNRTLKEAIGNGTSTTRYSIGDSADTRQSHSTPPSSIQYWACERQQSSLEAASPSIIKLSLQIGNQADAPMRKSDAYTAVEAI
jgi:hypothetical protein